MLLYIINKRFPLLFSLIQGITDVLFFFTRIVTPRKYTGGNVAVICLHKIGDSVFTFPAVKGILNHYKEKAYVVTYAENVSVYKLSFPDAEYISIDRKDFSLSGRLAGRSSRAKLKLIKPEIIIDLIGSVLSAGLIFNSGAKQIIGISEKIYRNLYDVFIPISYNTHLSDIYLNVTRSLGISEPVEDEKKIGNTGSPVSFLIFPSAGWPSKEWNFNKFVELALMIKSDYPVKFIFQKGSLKNDIKVELIALELNFIETCTVADMINEIKKHSDVISNDSGPSHIAETLGKRSFTIYGPTNPKVHKKNNPHNIIIYDPARCSPVGLDKLCFANGGRDCPSSECLRRLPVHKIYESMSIK